MFSLKSFNMFRSFFFIACLYSSNLDAKVDQNNLGKVDEFILSGLKEKNFENVEVTFHLPERELKSLIKNLPELAKSMKDYGASTATLTREGL
jgi:hypothetical protein